MRSFDPASIGVLANRLLALSSSTIISPLREPRKQPRKTAPQLVDAKEDWSPRRVGSLFDFPNHTKNRLRVFFTHPGIAVAKISALLLREIAKSWSSPQHVEADFVDFKSRNRARANPEKPMLLRFFVFYHRAKRHLLAVSNERTAWSSVSATTAQTKNLMMPTAQSMPDALPLSKTDWCLADEASIRAACSAEAQDDKRVCRWLTASRSTTLTQS